MIRKRFRSAACTFAALVAALGLASCEAPAWRPAAPGSIKLVVRETSLGQTAGRMIVEAAVISPDSRLAAYIVQRGPRQLLVVDGADGPEYDEVLLPAFSPDSSRIAYSARRGKQWFAVLDGREGPPFGCPMFAAFSPDSKRLAYFGFQGEPDAWGDRRDRYQSGPAIPSDQGYDIFSDSPSFFPSDWLLEGNGISLSRGGMRVAGYGASDGRACVVVDGVAGKGYDRARDGPFFSPDSRRVAYVAEARGQSLVVVDGVEGKPCNAVVWPPRFSPDSRHVAYVAASGLRQFSAPSEGDSRKEWVVLGGVEGRPYDEVMEFCFSPDSAHFACAARLGDMMVVILDGKEIAEHPKAFSQGGFRCYEGMSFSPDAKRLAYIVRTGGDSSLDARWCMVLDGVKGKEYYGRIEVPPAFSPDSSRLAYVAEGVADEKSQEDSGSILVVDGQERKAGGWIGVNGQIVFSPDSRRIAYIVCRQGKDPIIENVVVVDGKTFGPYDGMPSPPVFSPDSRHFAFMATRQRDMVAVVDGVEGPVYDGVGAPVFSPDSRHVAYIGWRAWRVYVVVDGLETEAYYQDVLPESALAFSAPDSLHILAGRKGEVIRVDVQIEHP